MTAQFDTSKMRLVGCGQSVNEPPCTDETCLLYRLSPGPVIKGVITNDTPGGPQEMLIISEHGCRRSIHTLLGTKRQAKSICSLIADYKTFH